MCTCIYYCIVYLNNSKVCIFCDVLHWCCFLCVYYKYIFHIFCQILKPNISPTHLTFIDFSLTCLRLIFKHPHQPSKMKWCGLKVTWSQCEFQILHFPRLVRTFIGKYLRPFPWTCSYAANNIYIHYGGIFKLSWHHTCTHIVDLAISYFTRIYQNLSLLQCVSFFRS